MPARLLTSRDIQALMGLNTPKAAERLMDDWKVPFVHLGLGRGRGRRWSEEKIMAAIKLRERDPGAATKPKKKATPQTIFCMSKKDALALTHGAKRA